MAHLSFHKFGNIGFKIELDSQVSTIQSNSTHHQNRQQYIGEGSSEIDNLQTNHQIITNHMQ